MAYKQYVRVSGVWQALTVDWSDVVGGPTNLSDLSEDSTSRHLSDTMISTYTALASTDGTTAGNVKMRLDGTTLYIRNDGTNA